MHKILKTLITASLLLIPSIVGATTTIPWFSTTTTSGLITPSRINGIDQALYVASSTATSTFTGNLDILGQLQAGKINTPATIYATGNATIGGILTVQGAGNSSFVGNVGIGTTNPGSTLDIAPSSRPSNGWIVKMLYSGLTTTGGSNSVGYVLGRDASNYNLGSIDFNYIGANSTSNYVSLGMYGLSTPALVYNGSGNVGIGTTTPSAKLSVTGYTSDTSPVFSISTTTGATIMRVLGNGHVEYSGPLPSLSSCGTNPVITATSTDMVGQIVVGGTTSTCSLNFVSAWTNPPICLVDDESNSAVQVVSKETISVATFSGSAAVSGDVLHYFCVGVGNR